MEVKFETNREKIRNLQALDEALQIITQGTKEGYFRSKGESIFKKFGPDSLIEDLKLIEIHIIKPDGTGEYKFNGNLSYNFKTKEVKFYILSVVSFDNYRIEENKMAKFSNTPNSGMDEDIEELKAIIDKIKKAKPAFNSRSGGGRHSAGNRDQGRKPGGNKGNYSVNRNNSKPYNNGGQRQSKEK